VSAKGFCPKSNGFMKSKIMNFAQLRYNMYMLFGPKSISGDNPYFNEQNQSQSINDQITSAGKVAFAKFGPKIILETERQAFPTKFPLSS